MTWTEKRHFKPYSGYFCYILANRNFDSTVKTLFEEYHAIKNLPLQVYDLFQRDGDESKIKIDSKDKQHSLGFNLGEQKTLLINILPVFSLVKFQHMISHAI